MNETTNGEHSPVSLMDSSKLSASTSGRSLSQELVEQLRRQLREAESENLALKRALPHLKDAKGDKCTEWAIKMANQLEDQKEQYRESQDKLALLTLQFRDYQESSQRNARRMELAMAELRRKAENLEEENQRLRDRLRDEESINFHLQNGDVDVVPHPPTSASGRQSLLQQHFEEALRHIEQHSEQDPQSGQSTERTDRPEGQGEEEEEHSFRPDTAGGSSRGGKEPAALEAATFVLFEKLRSTADFFIRLLNSLGTEAERQRDKELIEKIKNLRLDLNHSIEVYQRRMEELRRSAASSVDNSIHQLEADRPHCSKCRLVESERDALRTQLNREIALKEEYLASNEELERSLREMRRGVEEMRSELQQSQAKVEDIEQKLQRNEDYYCGKYAGAGGKQSVEVAELNDKIRVQRERNLELDAKNEEILRAVRRFKELSQEEMNNKDIELQRLLATRDELESRERQLEERCRLLEEDNQRADERLQQQEHRMAAFTRLEEELRRRNELVKRYAKKMDNLRKILASYGHYFDQSVDFESLVERSTEVLEGKVAEGQQRSSSSASHVNLGLGTAGQQPLQQRHNQQQNGGGGM